MALAYFIRFSTYGTWLHGITRGMGSVDDEHNAYGSSFIPPDSAREARARVAMEQPPFTMNAAQRDIVRDAIVDLAREKDWRLWAAHVRTAHVHTVITAAREPGRVMSDLKARVSRDLTRAGFDSAERRRWTRHGSTRHLFTEAEVVEKMDYTLNKQGAPMATHDGRQDDEVRSRKEEPRTNGKEPRTQ